MSKEPSNLEILIKEFLTNVLPGLILIVLGVVFLFFIDFRRVTGLELLLSGILLMLILIYFKIRK